jgi:hypothetical protein
VPSAPPATASGEDGASGEDVGSGVGIASALAPRGDGPEGDRAIQKALEMAWPADLDVRDQCYLEAAGRALLRADATGIGRERWPAVFPRGARGVVPAFGAGRFRIQAAIARHDRTDDGESAEGRGARAVVHLVWAAADRGGTYTDGRITDWYFTRTTAPQGGQAWMPQPLT